jgi:hypothetical protein
MMRGLALRRRLRRGLEGWLSSTEELRRRVKRSASVLECAVERKLKMN